MQLRRWLAFTGLLVLVCALGTPAFQRWGLGAATSLGTGLLWIVLFAASVLAGVAALLLAIPSSDGPLLRAARWSVQVTVLVLLAGHAQSLVTMAYSMIIGPKAEVIVPDGYSGTLGIRIRNPVEPGLDTIGRSYVYAVPPSGLVDVDSGWVAASFRFDRDGASLPDLYTTRMRWASGAPLRAPEFSCTWAASQSRALAMACAVRPGATAGTSIGHEEANRFFSSRSP